MAPKGGSTPGAGADTRTYRAAYGQPKMKINEKTGFSWQLPLPVVQLPIQNIFFSWLGAKN